MEDEILEEYYAEQDKLLEELSTMPLWTPEQLQEFQDNALHVIRGYCYKCGEEIGGNKPSICGRCSGNAPYGYE
jgi:hypothetical protein